MSIRALFWNVENYSGSDEVRSRRVLEHIRENDPDVLGFSEIKDKAALRSLLQEGLYDYDFGITDGVEGIELLAGWKRGMFGQALFTQRREFKAGNKYLRPGSLLSLKRDGRFFNFLFLHTDSGTQDKDYRNRQVMFKKIWKLRNRLNEIENANAHFVVMGDFNTMGRDAAEYPKVSAEDEINGLAEDARRVGMTLLDKSESYTWARLNAAGSFSLRSDLDHVLVSDSLKVLEGGKALVRGWVDVNTSEERKLFINEVSDHCSVELPFESV
ncbi:endonuclease/exonuclease/phosphatase family protein [Pseudovibrio denitrificans]|uniref:endonuclease/exonuclease/phosphatase family protein n=1 Tax=Pseudovibrio denitrificans TaxID=258256 RepID=UPI0039BF9823